MPPDFNLLALLQNSGGMLGGAAVVIVVLGYMYLQGQAQRRQTDANAEGNVDAIRHWQELARTAQQEAKEMRDRADTFARERNEALSAIGRLEGRIEELTRRMETQSALIESLREKIGPQRAGEPQS